MSLISNLLFAFVKRGKIVLLRKARVHVVFQIILNNYWNTKGAAQWKPRKQKRLKAIKSVSTREFISKP